jgi:biopolymer transport protein ExbD
MRRILAKLRRDGDPPEAELPLSMIDVTFLLLVFFMCSMQFKTIEQRLDADLPKDGPGPGPGDIERPTEVRVKVYWANGRGQPIHSAGAAFPPDWRGAKPPLSTAGAHVAMKVNRLHIRDSASGGPDLNELARTLRDLVARDPMPVVIDARSAVPFRWVIGALDACARARVRDVRFQAPPAPDGGGDDWWWL